MDKTLEMLNENGKLLDEALARAKKINREASKTIRDNEAYLANLEKRFGLKWDPESKTYKKVNTKFESMSNRFEDSIRKARAAGVNENDILKTKKDIDEYFG